jgi:prepilin-type N-terminal cleavage/methylation domain-containing protein
MSGIQHARRPGFTLVELLVAMTVFGLVMGIVMSFMGASVRAYAKGSQSVEASQNMLFLSAALQRELRSAGTNVPPGQPFLVYAGDDVVAFHADYVSNVGDPFAVHHDPDAPAGMVSSMTRAERTGIALTTVAYPDTTYRVGTAISPAELITFYFAPDEVTARTDDFALFRRVNGREAELVTNRILRVPDRPFFEYLRIALLADGPGLVPVASLPLFHAEPIHLAAADTGAVAVIDSIRGIRFNVAVTNGRTGDAEQVLEQTHTVWLRNAGLATQQTCGAPPLFGTVASAVGRLEDGAPVVELSWAAAIDETGGEEDVVRYVIWRTPLGAATGGDPFLSIPAGNPSYTYLDRTVVSGESWSYTIAAQDCTPSLSPTTGATAVVP